MLAVMIDTLFGVDKLSMFTIPCDSLVLEVAVLAVMIFTCSLDS